MKPSERIREIIEDSEGRDYHTKKITWMSESQAIIQFLDEQYTKQEEETETVSEHECSHSCPIHPFLPPSSTPIVEECGERCMCCIRKEHSDSISSCCSGTCKCHTSNKKI